MFVQVDCRALVLAAAISVKMWSVVGCFCGGGGGGGGGVNVAVSKWDCSVLL